MPGTCSCEARPRAPTSRSTRSLEKALARGASSAAWSMDAASRRASASARRSGDCARSIPEAQRKDGASLKHDISVEPAQLPRFIETGRALGRAHLPPARAWSPTAISATATCTSTSASRAGGDGGALAGAGRRRSGAPCTTSCSASAAASAPSTASASSRWASSSATRIPVELDLMRAHQAGDRSATAS